MKPDAAGRRPDGMDRISRLLLLPLGLLLVAACTADPGTTPSARPSLELASPGPTKRVGDAPGSGTRFSGILSSDAIEGGCAFLQAADGRRLEVIYPDGWRLERSPLALIAPDGTVHSRAGDLVTIVGDEADDFASICQIGPIVRASEVLDR